MKEKSPNERSLADWRDTILKKHHPYQVRIFSDVRDVDDWFHVFKFAAAKLISNKVNTREGIDNLLSIRLGDEEHFWFTDKVEDLKTFDDPNGSDNPYKVVKLWIPDEGEHQLIYAERITKGADVCHRIDALFRHYQYRHDWDVRLCKADGWVLDPSRYKKIDKNLYHIFNEDITGTTEMEEALENVSVEVFDSVVKMIQKSIVKYSEDQKRQILAAVNQNLNGIGQSMDMLQKRMVEIDVKNAKTTNANAILNRQNDERCKAVENKMDFVLQEINTLRNQITELKNIKPKNNLKNK